MAEEQSHTKLFCGIFVLLMILVGTTVAASRFDLGRWNFVVAVLIAATKAALIAWFFMHVRESRPLTQLVVMAGVIWLGILFTFSFADYWTRSQTSLSHASLVSVTRDTVG